MKQQSPRVVATIVWAALLAGATAFLGVALFLVFGLRGGAGLGAPSIAVPLVGASLFLSVVTVALSWLWAVRMPIARPPEGGTARRGAAAYPPGPEADGLARLIVSSALCEGGALFAVVAILQTGHVLALASYGLSWLALAAHYPGRRHWARLTGLPDTARRNPLIRG